MSQGITTSVRLPAKLRDQLETASHTLHRGKNWIMIHALEEYLARLGHQLVAEEAKRQSLLANQADSENDTWDEESDTTGWT